MNTKDIKNNPVIDQGVAGAMVWLLEAYPEVGKIIDSYIEDLECRCDKFVYNENKKNGL